MEREIHQHGESAGLYLLSFFESAGEVSPVFEKKARELFDEHGLSDIQPNEHYPTDKVVSAFQNVVDEIGSETMFQGGKQMGSDVPFPEEVTGPHQALQFMDAAHLEANRPRADAPDRVERPGGGYTYEQLGPNSARFGITEDFAFPAELGKGGAIGAIKNFVGDTTRVNATEVDAADNEKLAWEISWD